MKILYRYPSKWNILAGRAHDYFAHELARQCDCKLAGSGFPDQAHGINRVMWDSTIEEMKAINQAYWKTEAKYTDLQIRRALQMRYHIKRLYGNDDPDWVIGGFVKSKNIDMNYKLTRSVGDFHVNTDLIADVANNELDLLTMYCTYTSYIFRTVDDFRACFGKPLQEWLRSGHCENVEPEYFTKRLTTKWAFVPISYEPSVFKPIPESEKKYDVALIATFGGGFYPLRTTIGRRLEKLASEKGWKALVRRPPNTNEREYRYDISKIKASPALRNKWTVGDDYVKAIAESKIFIFGSSLFRYPVMKFMECMGSGALCMSDMPFHAEELHFKPGWNFAEINAGNWREQLEYYLDDDQLRETVARRGYETAVKYHTNEVRVKEYIQLLEKTKQDD